MFFPVHNSNGDYTDSKGNIIFLYFLHHSLNGFRINDRTYIFNP